MAITSETIAQLAPPRLPNHRSARYRADEQALELSALAPADREIVVALYAMLGELDGIVGALDGPDDPAALQAFVARHDIGGLVHRIRRLGVESQGDRIAEVVHDVRGGALTALFVHLLRVGRGSYRDTARALAIGARDHMKMMRNVLRDLDASARERDLTYRPHSLGDLANALREFTASVGEQPVVVDVDCAAEGVIAESCVECSAIDRVAYNLLNNAVRHADRPTVAAWLVTLASDLRVVIANSTSAEQRAVVGELLATDPNALFGSFTTSGSGHGLRIVSELVGRAYGVARLETLIGSGYVGGRIIDDSFVAWFHWPLSGA